MVSPNWCLFTRVRLSGMDEMPVVNDVNVACVNVLFRGITPIKIVCETLIFITKADPC